MVLPTNPIPLTPTGQPVTPNQNNLVNVAAVAAQATARAVGATQTSRAARPVGKAEAAGKDQSGTEDATRTDSESQVVRARTPGRGDALDVSV